MYTALVTANVFQNVFKCAPAEQDTYQDYYADLFRRLASAPVAWYMTAIDHHLAQTFWDIFRLRGPTTYQRAYYELLQRVKICSIDELILEESHYYYQLNFCDALRLACAVDHNLDGIVTWEPQLFVRTIEEQYQCESNCYFYINIPTESADPNDHPEFEIGVFSVGTFLMNLDRHGNLCLSQSRRLQYFRLERLNLVCEDEHEAYVVLRDLRDERLEATARGSSPFDAIQKAVDHAVEQRFPIIPPRYLSRFFVPQATLFGADAPVEVVIRVECAGRSFQASASHSNVCWAATDAYIKAINRSFGV